MARNTLNWPVVIVVTALCAISMVLFFVQNTRKQKNDLRLQEMQADTCVELADTLYQSEIEYFSQEADEYIATLPSDKQLVARLVDSVNHHLIYFETSNHPSCYILDLETYTTEVLFGGENGFYCDTKLLIVGTIRDWMRLGDMVYFIADNRAPEAAEPENVHVFALNIASRQLRYVDSGYDAVFRRPDQLYVGRATLLYHSLFTGEEIYDRTTETIVLLSE